jgi:hypothetical protein
MDHQLPRSTFQDHLGAIKVAEKLKEKMPVPLLREIVRKFLDVIETYSKVRTEETASVNKTGISRITRKGNLFYSAK